MSLANKFFLTIFFDNFRCDLIFLYPDTNCTLANTGTQPGLMIMQTPGQTQAGFSSFSGSQPNQATIPPQSPQMGTTFSSFVTQPQTLTIGPSMASTTSTTPPSGTVPSSQCYTALTGLVTSYFYAGFYSLQIVR